MHIKFKGTNIFSYEVVHHPTPINRDTMPMEMGAFSYDSRACTLLRRTASEPAETSVSSNTNTYLEGTPSYRPLIAGINNKRPTTRFYGPFTLMYYLICFLHLLRLLPIVPFPLYTSGQGEKVSSI
jgi:hypothetical protein